MPKENHSQPGHPLPAVDATEGRRNGKKVDKLPAEEGKPRRFTKNHESLLRSLVLFGGPK